MLLLLVVCMVPAPLHVDVDVDVDVASCVGPDRMHMSALCVGDAYTPPVPPCRLDMDCLMHERHTCDTSREP